MTFHPEVLTPEQRRLLAQLGPVVARERFYLGGGTAIALMLGHRRSDDLDWFTGEPLEDALLLARRLQEAGVPLATRQVGPGTLHGEAFGVRTSFLEYRYPLLQPAQPWPDYGCLVASLDDLACMKLAAIAQRGARKDFLDIYALGTEHLALAEMLRSYRSKYGIEDTLHVLRGLTYFDDADKERMPRLVHRMSWRTVKATILEWVLALAP